MFYHNRNTKPCRRCIPGFTYDYIIKLKHAKRFFPDTNLSTSSKESPTFLDQASKLHKSGVTHLHMIAGSDRVPEYKKKLAQYNGKHEGALFNFKKITVHSAGERDPDAEGTEGMSVVPIAKVPPEVMRMRSADEEPSQV